MWQLENNDSVVRGPRLSDADDKRAVVVSKWKGACMKVRWRFRLCMTLPVTTMTTAPKVSGYTKSTCIAAYICDSALT